MTAVTEKVGSEPAKDLYTDEPACLRDNVYQFQTDGVCVLDEGATRCEETNPQTRTGTWAQSNSGMTLKATIKPATQSRAEANMEIGSTIESVSATRLVLVKRETTAGVTTETRMTFTAQ
ncbi:hypothetical protein J4D97_20400 [Hymenobacter defluvii]|uniref:Lipocalin-like domain-containing protein n=2 Tax=Hymenobacter defluvii TaxID=2054411 RepID=A0ABS3TI21_9BACT|nr:hypothetical protein [Hymenobacter defluvii]